jgi:hypothetical protein
MKFIIFIHGSSRRGHYPRHNDFQYSEEHGLWIYMGRELDFDEFNKAAEAVFHPHYRGKGYDFCPRVVGGVPQKPAKAVAAEQDETSPFRIVGRDIYEGSEKVGGLFDPGNHVRTTKGKAEKRDAIIDWLKATDQLTP